MRLFLIPDVHEEWEKARKFRDKANLQSVDGVVWFGDLLDSFNHTEESLAGTIELVGDVLDSDDVILFGNHDIQYIFNCREFMCSGYRRDTMDEIRESGIADDWAVLGQSIYAVDGWWLSHAGVGPVVFDRYGSPEDIEVESRIQLNDRILSLLTGAGYYRGGFHAEGGPMWLDWNMEFKPIEGVNQVVGHTKSAEILRSKSGKNSINYCIDNGLQACFILDTKTGQMETVTL